MLVFILFYLLLNKAYAFDVKNVDKNNEIMEVNMVIYTGHLGYYIYPKIT